MIRVHFEITPSVCCVQVYGAKILFDALGEPMRQIAENAGRHGNFVVHKCENKEFGYGFNAMTLTYQVPTPSSHLLRFKTKSLTC
jgi:chaperonin GroEL (HSP60 family)